MAILAEDEVPAQSDEARDGREGAWATCVWVGGQWGFNSQLCSRLTGNFPGKASIFPAIIIAGHHTEETS